MSEIAKAYVQIIPSAKGIKGALSSTVGKEAGDAGNSGGQLLGSNLVTKLKGLIAGAGIGMAIKKTLDAGGAIQQSFGGLDTLYGKASGAAKNYAIEAAKAGISANSYAEQAVSFGAALKASFGGDVAKSAKAANQAIMDMADNSAKMGTDMESIQNAYQGFAKGNYTMLDNLKLGYGGTKTEMERLLADATKLTGVKYDINNFGDITAALHAVQDNLGITDVAAGEAQTTFTGSFGAMAAAAQNFLASLSVDEIDMVPALTTLVDTVQTFLVGNLLPMIGNILSNLPTVVMTAIDVIGPRIATAFPKLLQSGVSLVTSLINGVMQKAPGVITSIGNILNDFLQKIMSNYPKLLESGFNMIGKLVSGIAKNYPAIASAALDVIVKLVATITSNLPKILETGITLLGKLAAGIISAVPDLVGKIPGIIGSIKDAFSKYDWGSIGLNIIKGIAKGLKNAGSLIIDAAKGAAKSALDAAKNALGIHSPSRVFRDQVGYNIMRGWAQGLTGNQSVLKGAVKKVNNTLVGDVKAGSFNYTPKNDTGVITETLEKLSEIYNDMPSEISEALEKIEFKVGEREFGRMVRRYT